MIVHTVKTIYCDKCGVEYKDIFNSILTLDYEIPGKGKIVKMNLCLICRKKILRYLNG